MMVMPKIRWTICCVSYFATGAAALVHGQAPANPVGEAPKVEAVKAQATPKSAAESGAANARTSKTKSQQAKAKGKKEPAVKFLETPPTLDPKGEPPKPPGASDAGSAPEKPAVESGATKPMDALQPPLPERGDPSLIPGSPNNQLDEPVPGVGVQPRPSPAIKPPPQPVYSIGKIVVKYAGNASKQFPKLPTPEKLLAKTVKLAEFGGAYYHNQEPASQDKRLATPDPALPVSRIVEPEPGKPSSPALPPPTATPIPEAGKVTAKSGKKPAQKDAKLVSKVQVVDFSLADAAKPRTVSAEALTDIFNAIVQEINAKGVIGVYIEWPLDPRDGAVPWKSGADVEITVSVSEVQHIRTIARRVPFKPGSVSLINDDQAPDGQTVKDPKHLWIKDKSPIKVGALIEKGPLQDYLTRLNRFEGRRVDSAINASGEAGKVILDYLIKEQKPWSIYGQTSNTGTEATGLWRHRLGAEYKQLRNADDILRFEYVTSEPTRFQSAYGSYEMALIKPDRLKAKLYASYGQYSAQDIGFGLQTFEGENLTVGTALTWTPLYWHEFPLDISVGVEWFVVKTDNLSLGQSEGAFILPTIGIGTERKTEQFSLSIDLSVQASFGGPAQEDLDGLGRIESDGEFILGKWDIAASFYIEPLLYGKKWRDFSRRDLPNAKEEAEFNELGGEKRFGVKAADYFNTKQKAELDWKRGIRVHEVAFSSRGQYVVGDNRLAPQLTSIAGGFNTVRGYPESFSSGDNSWTASLEYRLHIARLFAPYEVVEAKQDMAMLMARKAPEPVPPAKGKRGKSAPAPAAASTPAASPVKLASAEDKKRNFNFRAPQAGAEPDWDLIFRVFSDGGQTFNNEIQVATEVDRTLLSVGAGIELQLFKPIFATTRPIVSQILPAYTAIRVDFGYVLSDETELLIEPVNAGDSRIHISGTIAW